MLARLDRAGVTTAVCHGIDAALATLDGWQLLKGKAQ
jgi:putative intracellular protease/amidase